jgi:hypothetical protein
VNERTEPAGAVSVTTCPGKHDRPLLRQRSLMDPDFDPCAFADPNPIVFRKSMEGAGLKLAT